MNAARRLSKLPRAAMLLALLVSATAAPLAQGSEITTYGAGLKSCKAYLDARRESSPDQVAFVDWLSGYFSGVNKTSNHRNNFFGLSDLSGAMYWLDDYCSARPRVHFAEAVGMLLIGGKPGPAAHALEVTTYGSADKSCEMYLAARAQQDEVVWTASAEFTNWLGGYLSGVNAMSLSTNNVLGKAELNDAVSWLEQYCGVHPEQSFSAAVDTLVSANRARVAVATAGAVPKQGSAAP